MARFLFVSLISSLFLFSSCSEELDNSQFVERTPLELADSYLSIQPNKALFAAVNVDHKTHHVKGIVVDKGANLRIIDMPNATYFDFTRANITELDIERLIDNSQIVSKLESIETADLHKLSKSVEWEYHNYETSPEGSSNFAVAFRLTTNRNAHGGCGGGGTSTGSSYLNTTFDQIRLNVNGKINFIRDDNNSQVITDWLQALVETNIES